MKEIMLNMNYMVDRNCEDEIFKDWVENYGIVNNGDEEWELWEG